VTVFTAIANYFVDLGKGFVRISSFFFKEIWAALRQPRLIFSVVLGPFLILAAFGIGYRGQTPELATTLVVPNDPRFSDDPATYKDLFSSVFVLQHITRDPEEAQRLLNSRQTDVVVIVPNQPEQTVLSGNHAQFEVQFRQIDPLQAAWVRYFATVGVQELNRRVLADLLGNGQEPAVRTAQAAGQLREQSDGLTGDLQAGNAVSAAARVAAMRETLQATRATPAASVLVALGGQQTDPLAPAQADLDAIQADLARGQVNTPDQIARAQRLQQTSHLIEQQAQQVTKIPPDVMAAPFSVKASNTLPAEPSPVAFFAPAVVALLLQHIAVSLASLSMVRDRLLGATEVYRVAPIGPMEVILGKSLSYGLLLGIVGAALVFLMNRLLGVPFLGDPVWAIITVGLLLFASLGLGFFISGFSDTETQAVQLAMLILLCSIFFGGFFLPLDSLWLPVRSIGYLLPVTFSSMDLRDVMLVNAAPQLISLAALAGLGVVCYIVGAWQFSRQMTIQ
jgi:ABC-2 type transport system permease protein